MAQHLFALHAGLVKLVKSLENGKDRITSVLFPGQLFGLESLADPSSFSGLDENDPGSVARWMKKMGREMGEEAGEDFEAEVDRAMEESEVGGEGESGGGGDDDI